jgi:SsrA-binding protein
MKLIAQNKKAFHDYVILEKLEAGLVLTGDEVKSLRAGHVSLVGAFASIHRGELYLNNCHITQYERAYTKSKDESTRHRKLLVHRRELMKHIGDMSRKGITIVPLSLYFNERNKVKVSLGLAKHKNAANRKQELRERDIKRETHRVLRGKSDD